MKTETPENWTYLSEPTASVIEVSRTADGGARITIGPRPGLAGILASVHADEAAARDLALVLAADPADYSTPPRLRRTLGDFRLLAGVDLSLVVWRRGAFVELSSGPTGEERRWCVNLRDDAARELAAYLRA